MIRQVLEHNNKFVKQRKSLGLDQLISSHANKEVMVFTCMDTRLVDLVEKSMGFQRGDIKILKNAGNSIRENCDEIIRCVSLGAVMMGLKEVFVVGHRDCGMRRLNPQGIKDKMLERGISKEAIDAIKDFPEWVGILKDEEENVIDAVLKIRNSEFVPKDIKVHGLIINPFSGELEVLIHGDENK